MPTPIKHILIAGEAPYVDILFDLCTAKGHQVNLYYIEDLGDPEVVDEMVRHATRCDIFIESLNESAASKLWLIEGVEANMKEKALVLTHALCASATEVASWCVSPQRVVGFGLLPPVDKGKVVEFAPCYQTDFLTAGAAKDFWEKLEFEVVRVPDAPGLVRARILFSMINEAIYVLDQQVATDEDIDTALQMGLKAPKGPLAWADLIGLDVLFGSLLAMTEFYGDKRFHPAPLLRQKVKAGHLGKKTGRGFFIEPMIE